MSAPLITIADRVTIADRAFLVGATYQARGMRQMPMTLLGFVPPDGCVGREGCFAAHGGVVRYRRSGVPRGMPRPLRMSGEAWAALAGAEVAA